MTGMIVVNIHGICGGSYDNGDSDVTVLVMLATVVTILNITTRIREGCG